MYANALLHNYTIPCSWEFELVGDLNVVHEVSPIQVLHHKEQMTLQIRTYVNMVANGWVLLVHMYMYIVHVCDSAHYMGLDGCLIM